MLPLLALALSSALFSPAWATPPSPTKPGCESLLSDEIPEARYHTVKVYHKGELVAGTTSEHRTFSTAIDRDSVAALDRAGEVHEFEIPEKVYWSWIERGLARPFRDLDSATGVVNEEVRFYSEAITELARYRVQAGEKPLAQRLEDEARAAAPRRKGKVGRLERWMLLIRLRMGF